MTWLWSIPAAATLLGAALLWFGVRGRRVDNHPICRRCGFDLFGKPSDSDVCSECGADLRKPRAIRDGRHVRRGWAVALGVITLAVSLTVGGAGGYAAYTVTDWQAKKPAWWLLREMRGTDAAVRDAAIVEVNKRISAATLSQANVDAIADHILAKQADTNTPWLQPLGDFVESAWSSAALGEERWRRYVRQAVRFELKVRPRVRIGDPVPFTCEMAEYRTAARSRLLFLCENAERTLGGVPLGTQVGASPALGSGGSLAGMIEPYEYKFRVSEGPQTLKLDCRVSVQERKGREFVAQDTFERVAEATFELCHPAQLTATHVYDESKVNAMRQPIRGVSVSDLSSRGNGRALEIDFTCGAMPFGIGYDVFLWTRGNWRRIGSVGCPPNTAREWRILTDEGDGSNVVSVLFEPSLDAAAHTLDTFEVWAGGQLTFTGIQVNAPRSALNQAVLARRQAEYLARRRAATTATTTLTTPAGR